jgi:hypothetical protein
MNSAPVCNGPLRHLATLVNHKNASRRCVNRFQRKLQDPLEQLAQIQLSSKLTANGVEQIKRGFRSFFQDIIFRMRSKSNLSNRSSIAPACDRNRIETDIACDERMSIPVGLTRLAYIMEYE